MSDNLPHTMPSDEEVPPTRAPTLSTAADDSTAPQTLAPQGEAMALARGLPGYAIVQELGRGAMGVVYLARQVALKRDVALKMILAGGHAGVEERSRFLVEAEVIASLQHPGIVLIHDFGTSEGLPFFAMEFCNGGTLARRLGGKPIPAQEAARIVAALADAVHAAHEKNVIHRDLKPGNILLTADGTPKVADFGLARRIDAASMTQTGAVMGTPAYLAPEQARGLKKIGPTADVWALGAILYECLTGKPPFSGETVHETLMQVIGEEPVALRKRNPAVPVELEAVCLKCLEKEPARRYASARELGEELQRFLAGESVQARRAPLARRAMRWARRRVWVCLAVAGVIVGLAGGVLIRGNLLSPTSREAELAPKPTSGDPAPQVVREEPPRSDKAKPVNARAFALLIGVAAYEDSRLGPLKYPERDVEELARVLSGPGSRFTGVRLLTTQRGRRDPKARPTGANVRDAVRQLTQARTPDDLLLLVLSGHGVLRSVYDPEDKRPVRSHPYFCPSDASPLESVDYATGKAKTLMNLSALFADLSRSGAGTKLVFLDVSRQKGPGVRSTFESNLYPIPAGVAALFSCRTGEQSFESAKLGKGHSVFAYFVIQGLRGEAKTRRGEVTFSSLADFVIDKVSDEVPRLIGDGAKQTPLLMTNLTRTAVLVPSAPGR